MPLPAARRWARLGLYLGVAVAAGITLYWAVTAGRADWGDWQDDPAVDAHRWASVVSVPVSFLAIQLWPALQEFRYWPWMVVLGPPLNGMALGAVAGFLRDRAGTRQVFDVTATRWRTLGSLILGAPTLWAGLTAAIVVALAVRYFGRALWHVPVQAAEALSYVVSIAWLATPLGLILIERAVPTARRWLVVVLVLGAAAFTVFQVLPRAPGSAAAFPLIRHVLAWLAIGFGATIAAAPATRAHAVPSPERLRLIRSALLYALITGATPFLVLSPLSLPAIVLLGVQIRSARRRHGADPGIPPAHLAQWGSVTLGLALAYAAVGAWLGAPALTLPRAPLDSAGSLTRVYALAGALLMQIGVWATARMLPPMRRTTAPSPADRQTTAVPLAAPTGRSPELAWAGLILALVLFGWSVAASSAGWHVTPRTGTAQSAAGLLMYLSGRAAAWPLARVFGLTIALLALHLLVLVPLLIAIR